MKEAYVQGEEREIELETSDQITPKDVGHNIYILAHQVRFTCLLQNTVSYTSDSQEGLCLRQEYLERFTFCFAKPIKLNI